MGLFSSCENPLTGGMGPRVTVGVPRITNVDPSTGGFIHGRAVIEGMAWAHRDLRHVEMRVRVSGVGTPVPESDFSPWRDIAYYDGVLIREPAPDGGIDGAWSFFLDTEDFNGSPLPDGPRIVQFRAFDNLGHSEIFDVTLNVKNGPSAVMLARPQATIDDYNNIMRVPMEGGAEIRGNVIDLRGLAPGYPKIQIWPRAQGYDPGQTPAPDDDHPNWGWSSMFLLSESSEPPFEDDHGRLSHADWYDWRLVGSGAEAEPIRVIVANFSFPLNRFVRGAERADGVAPVEPDPRLPGPLGSGDYYFRIRTMDVGGLVGYFPPEGHGTGNENPLAPGSAFPIRVMENLDPPIVEIDNGDVDPSLLEALPSVYVAEATSRFIALDDPELLGVDRTIFRLRVLARHSEGVGGAVLRWAHPATGRGGELRLDCAEDGDDFSRGVCQIGDPTHDDYRREVAFVFTADGRHRDIFTTHQGAYTLTLLVSIQGEHPEGAINVRERTFTVFMDGEGPRVEILSSSVRGAIGPPDGDVERVHGGLVNASPVTVNGNIQVSVVRSAAFGIPESSGQQGQQMVKWVAEEFFPLDDVRQDSVLARLVNFRESPTAANLGFFLGIDTDSPPSSARSGWVAAPGNDLNLPAAYRTHNFKLNTRLFGDGGNVGYAWLYVIAKDVVGNLGFAMQKIRVDQATDYPSVDLPVFFRYNANGVLIEGPEQLEVNVGGDQQFVDDGHGNWTATSPRRNILIRNQGIDFVLEDDDGIAWIPADVSMRLTALDSAGDELGDGLVDISQITPAGTPMDRRGTLTQATMAAALGHGDHLRDGFYRLVVRVYDSPNHKVNIGGDAGQRRSAEATYYFAVHTEDPVIALTHPMDGSLQPAAPATVDVTGTVRSHFQVRRLWIDFADNVTAVSDGAGGFVAVPSTEPVEISLGPPVPSNHPDYVAGVYTYAWSAPGVLFNPNRIEGIPNPELRAFTVRAFDSLAFDRTMPYTVRVDTSPPQLSLMAFDQLRPITRRMDGSEARYVWGNVHFRINAIDTHGLFVERSDGPSPDLLGVWWRLVPHSEPIPDLENTAAPAGLGGRFYFFPDSGVHTEFNARLDAVFDSGLLSPGVEYRLIVTARDNAGNRASGTLAQGIMANQALDLPALDRARLSPATLADAVESAVVRSDNGTLRIRGVARDEDRFYKFHDPQLDSAFLHRDNDYVEIQFQVDGSPWSDWARVPAFVDPTGALDFAFPFFVDGYFGDGVPPAIANDQTRRGDAVIRYRIRVTDEPGVRPDQDPLTVRNKNPQDGLYALFGSTTPSIRACFRTCPRGRRPAACSPETGRATISTSGSTTRRR